MTSDLLFFKFSKIIAARRSDAHHIHAGTQAAQIHFAAVKSFWKFLAQHLPPGKVAYFDDADALIFRLHLDAGLPWIRVHLYASQSAQICVAAGNHRLRQQPLVWVEQSVFNLGIQREFKGFIAVFRPQYQ